jgi:hypothetical protein
MSLVNVGVGFAGGAWAAPRIVVAATATSARAGVTSFGAEPIGFSFFFISNNHIELEDYLSFTYGLRWRYGEPSVCRQRRRQDI